MKRKHVDLTDERPIAARLETLFDVVVENAGIARNAKLTALFPASDSAASIKGHAAHVSGGET